MQRRDFISSTLDSDFVDAVCHSLIITIREFASDVLDEPKAMKLLRAFLLIHLTSEGNIIKSEEDLNFWKNFKVNSK